MKTEMKWKDGKIVKFPQTELDPAEQACRLDVEVQRLARQPLVEWMFWVSQEDHAQQYGITPADLKAMVTAQVKANEKKASEAKAEARRQEDRAEKERKEARREQVKAAQAKRKDREKELAAIAKLPRDEQEGRLAATAKRLDEDIDVLRGDLGTILPAAPTPAEPEIEPWPEPVATADILDGIVTKTRKHVAISKEQADVAALWAAFAWLHDIVVHSPMLIVISVEEDSGKSTLLGVIEHMVPKPMISIEPTGPSTYRDVDHYHPTLIINEGDTLFQRKGDLRHVINCSWTRNEAKIWRGGHCYDVFCPKALGVKGTTELPRTVASRGFSIKMWPATVQENEELGEFAFTDDDEFLERRRKLTRWSADNAEAIKALMPTYPPGLNNRQRANWSLLLKIAQHAGGNWPRRAHDAAVYLSRTAYAPSKGIEALAAMEAMFENRDWILSSETVTMMTADPDSPWRAYRGRGPISQYELAALLKQYDMSNGQPIAPVNIHPDGSARKTQRGYRASQFKDMFEKFADRIARVDTSFIPATAVRSQDQTKPTKAKPKPTKAKRKRKV